MAIKTIEECYNNLPNYIKDTITGEFCNCSIGRIIHYSKIDEFIQNKDNSVNVILKTGEHIPCLYKFNDLNYLLLYFYAIKWQKELTVD